MVSFTGSIKLPEGGFKLKTSLPPTWDSVTNLGSNHESKTITESPYSLVASDPEDDPLTYSLVSGTLPIGATINSNGTITGPAVAVTSDQQFDFVARVSDGVSSVDKAFFITVNENANPTWSGGTAANLGDIDEDSAISIQLTAVDSDGLPMALTYSEFGGSFPAWLDISSGGLLTGTAPSVGSETEFMFTVTASDGDETADRQFTLTIADVAPPGPQAFAWGRGNDGYTGLGDTINRSSPVQIGALTDWVVISTGSAHTLAIKTDGTLWSWGRGATGRLGIGVDINDRSSPVQIGSLTTWASVSAGLSHSLAIKTNGTMWGWGQNNSGQIGDGTTIHRSSPVQVQGGSAWTNAKMSSYNFNLVIRSNNTLWAWGTGSQGKLGLNSISNVSIPSQVTGGAVWVDAKAGGYHGVAVRTNGTLWSWGSSNNGQGGRGGTTSVSVPNQVGGLTTWASVSAGNNHSHAIKTTGALWSWGSNNQGRLGDGTTSNRSSPVPIGALTDWAIVSSAFNHSHAIKTDGTLWSWGPNSLGQLGDGTAINRSSPVPIGSETDWTVADPGNGGFTIAIRTLL